jgi:hypothetical protein
VKREARQVLWLGDVEEAPARTLVRRSGRRFSFPVEEPGPGPIEGWCSTKKPRRPAAGTLDYSLDANGGNNNVPALAPATRQVVTDLTETPPLEMDLKKVKEQVDELVSKARSEKDFLKVKEQVNELVTKSRSEVAEWLSELEVQRREVASL